MVKPRSMGTAAKNDQRTGHLRFDALLRKAKTGTETSGPAGQRPKLEDRALPGIELDEDLPEEDAMAGLSPVVGIALALQLQIPAGPPTSDGGKPFATGVEVGGLQPGTWPQAISPQVVLPEQMTDGPGSDRSLQPVDSSVAVAPQPNGRVYREPFSYGAQGVSRMPRQTLPLGLIGIEAQADVPDSTVLGYPTPEPTGHNGRQGAMAAAGGQMAETRIAVDAIIPGQGTATGIVLTGLRSPAASLDELGGRAPEADAVPLSSGVAGRHLPIRHWNTQSSWRVGVDRPEQVARVVEPFPASSAAGTTQEIDQVASAAGNALLSLDQRSVSDDEIGKAERSECSMNDRFVGLGDISIGQSMPSQIPQAAEPPTSRPLPEQLESLLLQVKELSLSRGETTEMMMTLEPRELGKLAMHVSMDNGLVTARFEAESHTVKQLIEAELPRLKEDLQQQGIHLDQVSVQVGGGQAQGFAERQMRDRQQSWAYRQRKDQSALSATFAPTARSITVPRVNLGYSVDYTV